jgi:hypothetical protein
MPSISDEEGKNSQQWKDQVSKELEQRLAHDKDWQAVKAFAANLKPYSFGGEHGVASGLVSVWAGTSGDHEPLAQAMQLAAREEFGLHSSEVEHMGLGKEHSNAYIWEKAADRVMGESKISTKTVYDPATGGYKTTVDANRPHMDQFKAALRAFTRAEYANTQQWFADKGIKEVAVFRGMKITGGDAKGSNTQRSASVQFQHVPRRRSPLRPDAAHGRLPCFASSRFL